MCSNSRTKEGVLSRGPLTRRETERKLGGRMTDTATTPDPVTPYDAVPYASYPYPQTQPNRIGAVARLFGVEAAGSANCRVLELGCASGGNLIPLAVAFPHSTFVGVDLSQRQIDEGQAEIRELGLTNISLQRRNLLEIGPDLGQFDYILCHGVYSWVPAEVRKHILTICRQNLAPQGVAYVSYNTYPGWRMRGTVRDLMVYHARKFDNPRDQAGHARALLDFLAKNIPDSNHAYATLLREELELLRTKSDAYLLHDHLEADNEPVYFHQFMDQAAAADLQYLGEADIGVMSADGFDAQVGQIISKLSANIIEWEQYLDFLRNRMFRQTLLCHKDISLDRQHDSRRLTSMQVSARLRRVENKDAKSGEETFENPRGRITTASPLLRVALRALAAAWPGSVSFEQLVQSVQSELYGQRIIDAERARVDADNLGRQLVEAWSRRFVEMTLAPLPVAATIGEHPQASPLARQQAQRGRTVTNLAHHLVELADLDRHIVKLADGSRSVADLVATLNNAVERRELVMVSQSENGDAREQTLRTEVERSLHRLHQESLLIS